MIRQLRATPLQIPLRQSFKHAAAERRVTESVWVEVILASGAIGYGEGCPRNYVTGETLSTALEFIRKMESQLCGLRGLEDLRTWSARHSECIELNPAAWCAVELALLDAFARETGQSVESLLGLQPLRGAFHYTAVIGAEAPAVFQMQLERYVSLGFKDFKVKLTGDEDDLVRAAALARAGEQVRTLRFDANNLWHEPTEAIAHLQRLNSAYGAVEEPLGPPGRFDDMRRLADAIGARIILDESMLRQKQLAGLRTDPDRWIINLRVSKLGGLLRTLEIAAVARAWGIAVIVGCQVGETSLLTRAALTVAQACSGRGLLAQEGAFGTHILTQDVLNPPLMFGAGGLLEVATYGFDRSLGFGIEARGF